MRRVEGKKAILKRIGREIEAHGVGWLTFVDMLLIAYYTGKRGQKHGR